MNIYELYGRLVERYEESMSYYRRTQTLLRDISTGNVQPSDLVVTPEGWSVNGSQAQQGKGSENPSR